MTALQTDEKVVRFIDRCAESTDLGVERVLAITRRGPCTHDGADALGAATPVLEEA